MVIATRTLEPPSFCLAKLQGGVQLGDAEVPLETIVPEDVPHLYVIVWYSDVDFLVTVNVCDVPNVPFEPEMLFDPMLQEIV